VLQRKFGQKKKEKGNTFRRLLACYLPKSSFEFDSSVYVELWICAAIRNPGLGTLDKKIV
jgi:hypothetical protein